MEHLKIYFELDRTQLVEPETGRGGEGGGGFAHRRDSSLCCAETVSNRKLKLCDFTIY